MRLHVSIPVAVLLALSVMLVFVWPAINLPQSTLQSRQSAVHALVAIVIFAFARLLVLALRNHAAWPPELVPAAPSATLVDLTCTRRC